MMSQESRPAKQSVMDFWGPVHHCEQHPRGDRGHRQGSYFARASYVLDAHLTEREGAGA